MFVAASTECFPDMPLPELVDLLVHLEFSAIELDIHEDGTHLKPSTVAADLEQAVSVCRQTQRLDVAAFNVKLVDDPEYAQFQALCKLAKAVKVVSITVESGELGTPFNEEVERLRKMVQLGQLEGVRVSIKTQIGRISQDLDTVQLMCNHVKGLGVTLDPSHFICGPHAGVNYDPLLPHVYNVHLRDTSKDELQVRVGQGEVDYGRLIAQLRQVGYDRALCVNIREQEGVDHQAELRKMRLLLESLLL